MKSMERRLRSVSVLSLDLFDTTLGRLCHTPEDVFSFLEADYIHEFGPAFTGFAEARRRIDSKARRTAWESRQSEEISLPEIYQLLLREHPDWPLTPADLAEREMAWERRLLYPQDRARRAIQCARQLGKQVIFISDMYLPEDFCRAALRQHGFTDFDHLFLSSSIGKLKHTGNLFHHVLEQLQIPPNRILHVGDNPHSDQRMARKAGLQTVLWPKASSLLPRFPRNPWTNAPADHPAHRFLLGLSARGCLREGDMQDPFWYRIGYQFAGPLLTGYTRFLIEQLQNRGIPKIAFLSRDGYILQQAYQILSQGLPDCPEPVYLHASRRALNFAGITKLDPRTEDWLAEGINLTVADFLQRIHLNPHDHLEAIRKAGFSGPEQPVVEGADYANLRQLYHAIFPAIAKAAARERKTYLDYLHHKGVLSQNPLPLVDVGWMTSIQHSFSKLLHPVYPDLALEGYYLGTYPEARQRSGPHSRHIAYLMQYGQPENALHTIRHCVCLLEFFFAAPEHTFLYMDRRPDGTFHPVLADFHENEADLPALHQIHQGALEYLQQWQAASPPHSPPPVIPPKAVLALLHRLLANPTPEEARRLGQLHYADGYGDVFHHTQMAPRQGFSQFRFRKSAWKQAFKSAHWPMGFYARLAPFERFLFRRFHPNPRFSKPYP